MAASSQSSSQQPPSGRAENGVDRTEDGRIIFKTEHYDVLTSRGQIRVLKLFPGNAEDDLEVHCELTPGTILDYKERMECDPPQSFVPFDALSWCWGLQSEESWISIRKDGTRYAKAVRSDLVSALRALRHHEHDRFLWIDAICIDQSNFRERNHQVEMMADIYNKADCVRVWLGNPTESSNLAIRFIKKEVLQLQHFDELCESKEASAKWKALLELMQRPWFSRRWVVQEVSLARKAIIHCGSAKISWTKFAVAVELFVEVETATHRLSEVMKKDPKYYHVPMWFEYVSALGASLLVDATGKLFRDYEYTERLVDKNRSPAPKTKSLPDPDEDANFESEDEELLSPQERAEQHERDDQENRLAPKGQPLLTLEYLVCSLSIFDTSKPHDTIYALLGIAKDTTPSAAYKQLNVVDHTQAALEMFTEKKQYTVDYEAKYVDICKEFIQFCINRSLHVDPSRALDVLCRPWASEESVVLQSGDEMSLPSWVPRLSKASYGMDTKPGIDGMKMGRKNADALVGLPSLTQRNYNAAETKGLDKKTFRFRKRVAKHLFDGENAADAKLQVKDHQQEGLNAVKPQDEDQPNVSAPETKGDAHGNSKPEEHSASTETTNEHEKFPTNGAPLSRGSAERRFSPKVELNYFSMYVKGFVLDKIHEVQPSSQNGSIPSEWADFAGWKRMQGNPPDQFWRTLVADRGRDGKNPPVYYSRACKESFNKGSFQSGSVDTTGLINNERNSVVAQFCRRVQAAIWNQALVRTEGGRERGRLGLVSKAVHVGDLVCILYGCSVPVILRRHGPKDPRVMDFEMVWELKHLADQIGGDYQSHLARKELFRAKREKDNQKYMQWEQAKREEWRADRPWVDKWKRMRTHFMVIHEFNSWVLKEKADGTKSGEEIDRMLDYINISLTDKCRPPSLPEEQKRFWDEFTDDKAWRKKWGQDNRRYSAEDGFRIWLREKGKLAGYAEEWKRCREAWDKGNLWRSRWRAENSRFLCIDSFRAWLRDKGKFCGPAELVKNKRDWELDTDWRRSWRSANPDASEEDEFNAWIEKSGRENTTHEEGNEVRSKEEYSQYTNWRKYWRQKHNDASLDDEWGAWKIEREKRAELEQNILKLRKSDAAKKQESEPFLERWRQGWRPPAVNWREFHLAHVYYRRWKRLVIRKKKEFLEEQKGEWILPATRKNRQEWRSSAWLKLKKREDEAVREQEARVPASAPKQRRGSRTDSVQREGRAVIGETGINGTSPTVADNDYTQAGAERGSAQVNGEIPTEETGDGRGRLSPVRNFPGTERSRATDGSTPSEAHDRQINDEETVGSESQDTDSDDLRSEERSFHSRRSFKPLSRAKTSKPVQEIQSELTENIHSKLELRFRIDRKKKELPNQWRLSLKEYEKKLETWKHETPRLVGPDGTNYYECGRKKDGKRRTRERLSEGEKRIYQESIVANFRTSLGDDGRWFYQFLGECYIHNMMDGEAMAHQNNECIPTTVFEIR